MLRAHQIKKQSLKIADADFRYKYIVEQYEAVYEDAMDTMRSHFNNFEYDEDGFIIIVDDIQDHTEFAEWKTRMDYLTQLLQKIEDLLDYEKYTFTPYVPLSSGGHVRFRRIFHEDGTFKAFQQQRKNAVGNFQEDKLGLPTFWQDEPGVGGQYLAQCLNKLIEDCIED